MNTPRMYVLIGMIVSISLFRVFPHPPNFTPVLAMALFGGAQFADRRAAFLVPLGAMLLADLFLGLHATMLFVYGALVLAVLMGRWLRSRLTVTHTAATAVGGSLVFYVVTNFGAWLTMPALYPRSWEGLMAAYTAAIPFYRNALAGDLLFTAALFGGFYLLQRAFPRLDEQVAPSVY